MDKNDENLLKKKRKSNNEKEKANNKKYDSKHDQEKISNKEHSIINSENSNSNNHEESNKSNEKSSKTNKNKNPSTENKSINPLIDISSEAKKEKLQKQLEFYFSDINLINDKFLSNILEKDKDGVDLSIIANFNQIKKILNNNNYDSKLKHIRKAVRSSSTIKLDLQGNKISRQMKFDKKTQNLSSKEIEEKTIYVENLPFNITHESLAKIFSKIGNILHISVPKFNDNINGNGQSGHSKGFAFITFDSLNDCENAIKTLNNSIPSILDNSKVKKPLKIISKKEWLEKKDEFKKLKQELQEDNIDIFNDILDGIDTNTTNNNIGILTKGTLVKLSNLPDDITKSEIRQSVSHIYTPQYVDLNISKKECILRFSHKIFADSLILKFSNENKSFRNKDTKISLLEGEEEDIYLKKIEKLRTEFKQNKKKINKNN